jgi:hypothetical protein
MNYNEHIPSEYEEEVIVSYCCGVEMTPLQEEYGICPKCLEHCETETQIWPKN